MTIRNVIIIGFVARLCIAVWNGFWGPSFGADLDAQDFHSLAVEMVDSGQYLDFKIGTDAYSNFLGFFYILTFESLFLGSLLSCVIWSISAIFFAKCLRILSLSPGAQVIPMILYAFLPSSVMFTSVTLREAYQLLFVNISVYSVLKIYLHRSPAYWLSLLISAVGMGLLHGGLFAFGVFLVVATVTLLVLRGHLGLSLIKMTVAVPLVAAIVLYGFSAFTSMSYNLDEGLATGVLVYQEGGMAINARAQYKVETNIEDFSTFLRSIPVSLFQYLFEPMPWKVTSYVDLPVLFENIFRVWLVRKAYVGLRRMPRLNRRPVIFIVIAYLMLETIWSLGTVNWGTAVRHHLPSLGLLLIAAFAYSEKSTTKRPPPLKVSSPLPAA